MKTLIRCRILWRLIWVCSVCHLPFYQSPRLQWVMVDYLQKRQTANGTYYASLLTQLRENIKFKRCWKLSLGVLFSPGQCFSSHVYHCYGCHQWLWLWFDSTSPLLAWSHSIRLLFIPKVDKGHFWYPLTGRWWCHTCSGGWTVKKRAYFIKCGIETLQRCWQNCIDIEGGKNNSICFPKLKSFHIFWGSQFFSQPS